MKYIFASILFLHGAIHLMGFVKAFKLAEIEQLTAGISKFSGLLWLLAFLLLVASGISFLSKADAWYLIAFAGMLLSVILIISAWKDAKFGMIPNLIILAAVIIGFATSAFITRYQKDVKNGLSQTTLVPESILTEEDIINLPEPVKKYIRYTGFIGRPKVTNFKISFRTTVMLLQAIKACNKFPGPLP